MISAATGEKYQKCDGVVSNDFDYYYSNLIIESTVPKKKKKKKTYI